jgi:hypothetical protein
MKTKLFAGLLTICMSAAVFAGDKAFEVNLVQDSIINGQNVKAGSYRVAFENDKAVLKHGKQVIEVAAKEETVPNKFESNEVTYTDKNNLRQINVGGTHTKIIFGAPMSNSGM